MRQVAVLGIGQTKVDEHWDKALKELVLEAAFAALQEAGIDRPDTLYVGNMLSPIVSGQNHLGTLAADWLGLRGIEAAKVEAACGSGAAAFRAGLMAVASGEADSALVIGAEKMSDRAGHDVTAALATAADADYEVDQGVSFVGLNALVMRRYMHEYGWKHVDFAPFSINAHANALHNPFARLHEAITLEKFEKSSMVATPINLLDASPTGDGAAAMILVPAERVYSLPGRRKIIVAGSASATDRLAIHSRSDPLWLTAAYASAQKAYQMAGISPAEVDVFELHDAFSIMTALSLEACGFAERGQGPRLGLEGATAIGGKIPVCTRGGLKARGHPVGATGMYQLVEVVQQLRGECGKTQVEGARIGLAQNIGGSGATILTHVLQAV
ncbi:MAG: acetyl-CoA acetyltransferase [Anaerolineae bacterium CG_4_9_14_3_um_filter_57_17]|nr:thiolase domain-containing protein [bacterium]NCT20437.1 thiolase domain-containing protein [bacterium]OIO83959.1 MAG: acetyl-CoA acetyltransferase [Anaerolineae bacterium CG2_30_57_67]PJB65093.1 MAG: acetyl-CoA acetyltransferase [Anaerolineae bacterium CG_4_9_14_3_um_filter_57_17]